MNCPVCGNSKISYVDFVLRFKNYELERQAICLRCKSRFNEYYDLSFNHYEITLERKCK